MRNYYVVAFRCRAMCTLAAFFLIALAVFSGSLFAQTTFGSVTGVVTDATAAPTPGAQVTLTNLDTAEKRVMTTGNEGIYQFVNLTPGRYRLDIEKTGFKRVTREPVVVEVQSTVRIDISLQVGEVTETVEVAAATPLLQPETSSLGQVVEQRKVNELPLNGRNVMSLVALVPSVVPQGQSMQNPNGTNPFAWGNFQIGGGMANQSLTLLDGASVNGGYLNITALVPTQDSVQEFKVQTNNLSAEFGRFAGGVINMTTRSGSNDIHGSAWEFLRNKDLNANNFFNNRAGVPTPAFTQNQFGFNLGGPVYIPKLYDGRNKTFFFFDYEGFRLRQGQSYTETVPTAAERGGDFSNLRDASGNVIPIYDPLTTTLNSSGNYVRQQFAGNIIPQGRLNPTALKFLQYYPLPNTTGNALTGVNNYVTNASVGGNNNESVVRLDQSISDKQHLFARYTYWGNLNLPNDPFRNGTCQDRCTETFNTNNFMLDDVYTLNPTTILDVRLSYQRFNYDRTPETGGFDLTTLGWPAFLNTQAFYRDLPTPCITGFDPANIFCSNGTGSIIIDRNDNYRGAGSLTKIMGGHTLKFGGEYMRITHNYAQTNNPTGAFGFSQSFTVSDPNHPVGGSGLATFLLGYPTSGSVPTPALVAGQQLYSGLFVQDDWKVTRKLTLNLGFRWEHDGPWTERFDRLSYFDPNAVNPFLQSAGLNYKGSLELVNSSTRGERSNINPNWHQFGPRLGAAYQLTSKTVLRTGWGLFWLPNDVAWNYSPNNDFVNSFSTPFLATVGGGVNAFIPANTLSNPFPTGIQQPPGRDPSFQKLSLGQGVGSPIPGNLYGYTQQWNFDVQQQFMQGLLLDVAYAGSKGTHLPFSSQQINTLPDQYLSLGTKLQTSVPNPLFGIVQLGGLSGATTTYGQLLRPYPQFSGVGLAGEGSGNSLYHSLQVSLQKRFSSGASIAVAYTWAKLISDTDTITGWLESGGVGGVQDWNNLRLERSLASFDTPHRLVASYVMDLPFGKGRKYLSNSSTIVNEVIGGWGVEGVTTIQSGFPLHFGTAQNLTNSYGGGSRPNVLGPNESVSGSAQQRLNGWFNVADFGQPPAFTYGNEPRNDPTLRSAGIANWDFSTFKDFFLSPEGRVKLEFRAEIFNLFNRVQFGYPGQTFGTPQFGIVSSQQNLPRLVQFALRLKF